MKKNNLQPRDFITTPQMQLLIEEAESLKSNPGFKVSDVIDHKGHQYVDLVQEGGGVLGIALLGYTFIMEKAGLRFFNLGGTSAGAINTMLLAGCGKVEEEKSTRILEELCNKNLFDFVDGDGRIGALIKAVVNKEGNLLWRVIRIIRTIWRTLRDKLGLNPGDAFTVWLSEILGKYDIRQLSHLEERLSDIPDLNIRGKGKATYKKALFTIIAADVTTKTKVNFPLMAPLYWKEPLQTNPSVFVRASMSIPFFFEPLLVKNIPEAGKENSGLWWQKARYSGMVPSEVSFVDGGMLSNFPINVFHSQDQVPQKPTFGARLSSYREAPSDTASLLGYMGAMISTMRQVYDLDFLLRNADYKKLICRIDADEKFNWLDFDMKDEEKIELFYLGAKKGLGFLKTFDWEAYKQLRRDMLDKPGASRRRSAAR